MPFTLELDRSWFTPGERTLCSSGDWTISTDRSRSGVEILTLRNSRGHVEILPFLGQIIWDAVFDGESLRMTSIFDEPRPVRSIVETYGCFAFHSGLLAAGCPAPEDDHDLHGEFACAPMDTAQLVLAEDTVTVRSSYEYAMGFGHHYRAEPAVTMRAGSALLDIDLEVTNLSAHLPMPLQYMCHLNHALLQGGRFVDPVPEGSFTLRESIPAHVTPTPRWEALQERLRRGELTADALVSGETVDPEVVLFADTLPTDRGELTFLMSRDGGPTFLTRFDPSVLPVATRWILATPDQQVAAFVLPGTSRPEGFLAAERAGTLRHLAPGDRTRFSVTTGLVAAHEREDI